MNNDYIIVAMLNTFIINIIIIIITMISGIIFYCYYFYHVLFLYDNYHR